MDYSQRLEQELDEVRERFRQYQVEMALRLDRLERRIEAAEDAPNRISKPRRFSANVPPAVPSYGYASTAPGSVEILRHSQTLSPVNTMPARAPPLITYSNLPAHLAVSYSHSQLPPPRGAARPSSNVRSHESVQYLPYAMEAIVRAFQSKNRDDCRIWFVHL